MSVHVYLPQLAGGIMKLERPGMIGRALGPSDFDDQHVAFSITNIPGTGTPPPEGYVMQTGDRLEFDLFIPEPESGIVLDPPSCIFPFGANAPTVASGTWTDDESRTTAYMGVDLKFIAGPYLSDGVFAPAVVLDDVTGINVTARGDKISFADGLWHHLSADLSYYANLTLDYCELACDEDVTARYVMYVRNIFITRSGLVAHTIFMGYMNPYGAICRVANDGWGGGFKVDRGLFGPLEIYGDLGAENLTGPYTSPAVTLLTGTTFTASDNLGTIYNNSTTGNMTVTLYEANTVPAGRRLTLINLHASNTLTVARAAADLIDGATSKGPYGQYGGITIESDGLAAFHVVP